MTNKQEVGKRGEEEAAKYLKNKGYKIIHRNYRHKWGDEIDIVSKDRKGILVFVEVKTIRSDRSRTPTAVGEIGNLQPEDNLNFVKLRKLKRSCEFFANAHPELVGDRGWQIDLVAIVMHSNDLTDKSSYVVRHYENI